MTAVLGVDLSLTSTGLASAIDGEVWWAATVGSKGHKGATWGERHERLVGLVNGIGQEVGDRWDLIVVEAPSYGSQVGSQHDRSGLWWLAVDMLSNRGPVRAVPPSCRARYAAGRGNADKETVFNAVVQHYSEHAPVAEFAGASWRKANDKADAVILAAMGARVLGEPVETTEPDADRLAGMAGVPW